MRIFSSLSEGLAPEELIRLLNLYFSRLTAIILQYQGTLDKFIGDAIMAFWGAPLPLPRHAALACQAALAIRQDLETAAADWQRLGFPPLKVRIGLHTGPVIVGNVGSRERFDYTVIGDTVNLASRLEGVNKLYGTQILLSEATCHQVRDEFLVRELDLVRVKGRKQPVAIFELLGRLEERPHYPWLDAFAAALAAYRAADWHRAAGLFQEVLREKPADPPSCCFLQRLQHLSRQPPPAAWDGVYNLNSK